MILTLFGVKNGLIQIQIGLILIVNYFGKKRYMNVIYSVHLRSRHVDHDVTMIKSALKNVQFRERVANLIAHVMSIALVVAHVEVLNVPEVLVSVLN